MDIQKILLSKRNYSNIKKIAITKNNVDEEHLIWIKKYEFINYQLNIMVNLIGNLEDEEDNSTLLYYKELYHDFNLDDKEIKQWCYNVSNFLYYYLYFMVSCYKNTNVNTLNKVLDIIILNFDTGNEKIFFDILKLLIYTNSHLTNIEKLQI